MVINCDILLLFTCGAYFAPDIPGNNLLLLYRAEYNATLELNIFATMGASRQIY